MTTRLTKLSFNTIKQSFLFAVFLMISMVSYAQLSVDAGKDTTFCTGQNIESLQLGTNVKIENGKVPYAIAWECKIPRGPDSYFTASKLLSDTTILSPYFLYNPINVEWIKFTLHVTDSKNNYAKDSIYIRFSKFGYLTGGGQTIFFIEKGDSILLNIGNVGIMGGIPPLTYRWQPKTYLSRPDSSITWCKPDSTVIYSSVAIDSCGCLSYPQMIYDIRVLPETNDNKPEFLEPDKTWVFLLAGDYPYPEIYADLCYKIGNDTIIEEVRYKKLLFSQGCDKYDGIRGFIRETDKGKVYFLDNKFQKEDEFLLYDFGMEAGDSTQIGWYNSYYLIDSTRLNSDGKKLYYTSKSTGNKDLWIEGVGSEMGLLREQITGGAIMFSCCFLNDEQLYHNPDFVDCYFKVNSNKKLLISCEISIFPNPAKNQITISNPSYIKIKKIEMFDFSGRVVQMWAGRELAGNQLNIQHILPGIYLLKAETEAGIKTEKLVVR